MMQKNNPTVLNAWCSYDWANSVYNLIVTTAIFPIYYSAATRQAFGGEEVQFFGLTIKNTVLYTYAISFSFFLIVLLSPLLSGIADYSGRKKRFMQFFTYMGATACIGLYFFHGSNIEWGILCAVLASVGYAGSLVFYNGFLPEIATADRMDRISARGFSFGYVGSVILLLITLGLLLHPEVFGFGSGDAGVTSATRFGFLLVGVWWVGFAQIAFYHLKDRPTGLKLGGEVLGKGFQEIRKVLRALRGQLSTLRFLLSFFFYSMGVQTVMLLAPLFGESEVGISGDEMILVVLILQVLAIAGALFFAWTSGRRGNGFAISSTLLIWMGICVLGYLLQDKLSFYGLAGLLGFVMGGIQAVSRSTYSKLIPEGTKDTASYFSFYDITEKLAIVLGTFSYGLIEQLTGSMRNSMLFMTLFFLAGFVILQTARLQKSGKPLAAANS
ncbi:MFS transporter [Cesiribacter andamanensis]|uniref:Vacuole effluxer Atg22 like protein n=1 Tax=Cesiribacter andamanensis AMV16 TaxID=1279009 RepID=M7N303_9BACT|nr:MFS transporter [Cesiribacter andamanensis]EMR03063.1 Vacuole effluxer Atg22 like protein [Cesiribacter andamanensis AMV16]